MKRVDMENLIRNYLLNNGVDKFWTSSAMVWIQSGLAGNKYFVTRVSNPKLEVDTFYNCVVKFECKVDYCMPDQPEGKQDRKGKMVYAFDKKSHKVRIS